MWQAIPLALLMTMILPAVTAAQPSGDSAEDEVLVRVNGSDSIGADERVSVAVVVSGDFEISGELVEFGLVADGDMMILNGARVDGTLVIVNGTLTMRDGSVVTGDVVLANDANWVVEEGARFTGEVSEGDLSFDVDRDFAWQLVIATLAGWLGATLIAVLGATVFAGIGGAQLWSSAGNLSARPGGTILSALGFWFAIVLLSVPLTLSVFGILALPILFVVAHTVWFLGYLTFATRIGASMTGQRTSDLEIHHPYRSSIAGTVALQFILLLAVGTLLGAVLSLTIGEDQEGLALVFGVPAMLLYGILFLAGLLGGGALILKAIDAWSADGRTS